MASNPSVCSICWLPHLANAQKHGNWQTAPFTISMLNYHFTRLSYMCIAFLCISWCKASLDSQKSSNGNPHHSNSRALLVAPPWHGHDEAASQGVLVAWNIGNPSHQWGFHGARLILAIETYSRGVIKIEIIQYVCVYIYIYIYVVYKYICIWAQCSFQYQDAGHHRDDEDWMQ